MSFVMGMVVLSVFQKENFVHSRERSSERFKMTEAGLERKVDDLQSTVNRLSQQIDHYFTSSQVRVRVDQHDTPKLCHCRLPCLF